MKRAAEGREIGGEMERRAAGRARRDGRGQGEERKMGRDRIINVRIMKTGEMRSKLGENSWEAARVLFFFFKAETRQHFLHF